MFKLIYYETKRGDQPAALFLEELDKKTRAKVVRYLVNLLAVNGPNVLRPFADVIHGKLREFRIRFSSNSARIIYFFFRKEEIILLHGFLKKTNKLNLQDIEIAENRMKDWIERHDKK